MVKNFLSCVFLVSLLLAFKRDARADHVRIAFGSCIDNPVSTVWDEMRERKPSAVVLLGDTVYLDDDEWLTFDSVWKRYQRLIEYGPFARLRAAAPLYAVWDDHDYGPNDSDATFAYANTTKRAFRKAFPNNPTSPAGLEDLSTFSLELGPVEILALDSRSARRYPAPGAEPIMFGDRQLDWLAQRLSRSTKKVVIILSPNQVLPSGKSDELLSQYPHDLKRVITALERTKAIPVIASGDRHYGEIVSIPIEGREVFEITSSPLTATPRSDTKVTFVSERAAAPRTSHGELVAVHNFGVIDVFTEGSKVRVQLELVPVGRNEGAVSVAQTYEIAK